MTHSTATRAPQRRRIVLAAALVLGVVTMSACGSDDTDMDNNEQTPETPLDTNFGTTAIVDNSSVNGGDTPVETNEQSETPSGSIGGSENGSVAP